MANNNNHIVMFPYMAQGHIIPFLALSHQLEQKGYKITIVNTPLNIAKLRGTLPSSSTIRLLEIPFDPTNHNLPPHTENTDSLPPHKTIDLLIASTSLKPHFKNTLNNLVLYETKPLCVIADFFIGWAADVSHEFGIFHVIFSGSGAFGLACYYSSWMNLPHKNSAFGEFSFPDFEEAGKLQMSQLTPSLMSATGDDPWSNFQKNNMPLWANCDGFLFNSVENLDQIGLSYFRRKFKRPVWAVGPISLSVDKGIKSVENKFIQFLDSKPKSSVLYISFGSQNTISTSQMMQLALALDKSNVNFIWVVRPPIEFDINAEFKTEEWLPKNFKKKAEDENRGLIVEKWAPQVDILSHKSVGGFMSHCGWNSILESLICAVPLLGWPMAGEQFYNAIMMVEFVGVCVEVARGVSFEVVGEDLRVMIEDVMSENGKGKMLRMKASEVKKMIEEAIRDDDGFKGTSVEAVEDFLKAPLLMKNIENKNIDLEDD
nr:scopoletin glycosyltransferase UGT1 [Artemisia annua]